MNTNESAPKNENIGNEKLNEKKPMIIDVPEIIQIIKSKKKCFIITLSIAFVIGAIIMWSTPKYYACHVKLAPETTNTSNALSSLASSFGLKIANQMTEDAIVPEFYPDVLESTDFVISLFNIHVETEDGTVKTTYYDYLSNYQKSPWWDNVSTSIKEMFSDEETDNQSEQFNAFRLTKKQTAVMKAVAHTIGCSVDKKTDVITIFVEDPDPLVCATVTDSVRQKLQDFITTYRTSKARTDLEYLQAMRDQVYNQYKEAEKKLTRFIDSNHDLYTAKDKAYRDDLQNEVDIYANSYNNLCTQIQLSEAKVQAKTPAFTILQSATVPIKPVGPHRTQTLLLILLATFVATTIIVVVKTHLELS